MLLSEQKSGCLPFRVNVNELHSGTNERRLVNAVELLELLFSDKSRPTLRWLRNQQKLRRIRFRKVGKLVLFDPEEVRADWHDRFTVGQKIGGAQ